MRRTLIGLMLVLTACAQQPQQRQAQPAQQPEKPPGPREVTVKAVEYEFQGLPATLPAGRVRILLENAGQEPHEFGLVRIIGDQTVEELLQLGNRAERFIEDVGSAFARPGKSNELTVTLEPGRYGYACFVTTHGQPHALAGMFGEFEVA
jgi:uncharacterized cupredoxin-like copper-binding protein